MGTQNLFHTSQTKMIPRDAAILSVWLLTERFTDLIQFATTINGPVTTAEKTKSISYRKETAMILLITMKELKRNHGHHLMRTLATALSVKKINIAANQSLLILIFKIFRQANQVLLVDQHLMNKTAKEGEWWECLLNLGMFAVDEFLKIKGKIKYRNASNWHSNW